MRKRTGRCVHCLHDGVEVTDDHVFPRSWYPAGVSPFEKWKAPSCAPCNNRLGAIEQRVLVRLTLCMNPDDPMTAKLCETAERAMDPRRARDGDIRDSNSRRELRGRVIAEIGEMRKAQGLPRPEVGGAWLTADVENVSMDIGEAARVFEKIVRGLEHCIGGGYIEAPFGVVSFTGTGRTAGSEAGRRFLAERGERHFMEPGFEVRRAMTTQEPPQAFYSVIFWGTWEIFATIAKTDEALLLFDNAECIVLPLARHGAP